MMAKAVIPHGHQGNPVHVNADGWPHATEIAARFGRESRDWLRLHELHFWRWAVIQCRNASLTQTGNSRFAQIDTESHMHALARCLGLPFEPKFSGSKTSGKVTGGSSVFRPELSSCAGLVVTKRGAPTNGGGTWLHPKLAVMFARWLDAKFAIWCGLQIDAQLRGNGSHWAAATRGHRAVCDAVALNCEARGKTPQRHHFINEARLINEVITGAFAGRSRDQLNAAELESVTLVELRDTALLGAGMSYAERKANLLRYAQTLQTKHLTEGNAA